MKNTGEIRSEAGRKNLKEPLIQRQKVSIFSALTQDLLHSLFGSVSQCTPVHHACAKTLTMNKLEIKHLDSSRVKQLPLCSMPNKYWVYEFVLIL